MTAIEYVSQNNINFPRKQLASGPQCNVNIYHDRLPPLSKHPSAEHQRTEPFDGKNWYWCDQKGIICAEYRMAGKFQVWLISIEGNWLVQQGGAMLP